MRVAPWVFQPEGAKGAGPVRVRVNLRGQAQRGPLFHPQPLVFCGQFGAGAAHARVRVNPGPGLYRAAI